MKHFIIAFYYLINIKIFAQNCNEESKYFDKISKNCLQCHELCQICVGPNINQCLKCVKDYYFYQEENICTQKCDNSTYQNENTKECIKCQILGCQKCNSPQECIKCVENFELLDGQCYLKQNTCINSQLYDVSQKKCVYSCQENQIQNDDQNTCQNIQECNKINIYSEHQIQYAEFDEYQANNLLSNGNIAFYWMLRKCKFQIVDSNLQLIWSFEFTEEEVSDSGIYDRDKALCVGESKIVIYDLVKQQDIKTFNTIDLPIDIRFYSFFKSNILIFNYDLQTSIIFFDLQTDQKYTIKKPQFQDNQFYLINNNHKIILSDKGRDNQTKILEININKGIVVLENLTEKTEYAGIVDDSLGIFFRCFDNKIKLYQIEKQDTFSIHQISMIDQNDLIYQTLQISDLFNLIFVQTKNQNLLIFQGNENWKILNQISQLQNNVIYFQILSYQKNKNLIFLQYEFQYCFLEINDLNLKIIEFSPVCTLFKQLPTIILSKVYIYNDLIYLFIQYFQNPLWYTQIDINTFNTEQYSYQQVHGYFLYREDNERRTLSISSNVKQQFQHYYKMYFKQFDFDYLIKEDQHIYLYNYQYNKLFKQNIIRSEDLFQYKNQQEQNILKIQNKDDWIIFYEYIQTFEFRFRIVDYIKFKPILELKFIQYKYYLIKSESTVYIQNHNILLLESFNLLIDFNKNKIIDYNSQKLEIIDINKSNQITLIKIFKGVLKFNYCYDIEDKLYIIQNKKNIYQLDLNSLKGQILQINNIKTLTFFNTALVNQDIGFISKYYLYLILNDQIVAYSLQNQIVIKCSIQNTKTDSKYSVLDRFFVGIDNYLYLFHENKVEKYNLDLSFKETIKFQIKRGVLDNEFYPINKKYFIFVDQQNIYKFNIESNQLEILTIFKIENEKAQITENYFLYYISIFGQQKQYFAFNNIIVNSQQMQIIKQMESTWVYVQIIQYSRNINNISISFKLNSPYSNISYNLENLPFASFKICSDAKMIYSFMIYTNYYLCVKEKLILKINLLSKIRIKYKFDFDFDLIVVDPDNDYFIFTSDKKELNLYNPVVENTSNVTLLILNEEIASIDICISQKKVIIRSEINLFIFDVTIVILNYLI